MPRESALPGRTVEVDWPIEVVVVEIEVVAPRELNPLEWALERVLDEFGEQVPTLAALSRELDIGVPMMLRDVLQALVELGAVESHGSDQPLDLPHCRLTTSGRELLSEGRVGGLPERHGLRLHFDAITGEHLCKVPKNTRTQPASPVVPPEQLPDRLAEVGLDRVRKLSVAQAEPFHKGESRIRSAAVRWDQGGHLWLPRQVKLTNDHAGAVRAHVSGGTEAQQAWFARRYPDLQPFADLGSATTSTARRER